MPSSSAQHWMTFATFAEQDHFIYPSKDTYHGIVINGNMAAYAPDGLAAFLLQKNRPRINYIIDPITHAFQHNPIHVMNKKDGGEIKKAIRYVAEIYGGSILEKAGKFPLVPSDIHDVTTFVKNCTNFQRGHLANK